MNNRFNAVLRNALRFFVLWVFQKVCVRRSDGLVVLAALHRGIQLVLVLERAYGYMFGIWKRCRARFSLVQMIADAQWVKVTFSQHHLQRMWWFARSKPQAGTFV